MPAHQAKPDPLKDAAAEGCRAEGCASRRKDGGRPAVYARRAEGSQAVLVSFSGGARAGLRSSALREPARASGRCGSRREEMLQGPWPGRGARRGARRLELRRRVEAKQLRRRVEAKQLRRLGLPRQGWLRRLGAAGSSFPIAGKPELPAPDPTGESEPAKEDKPAASAAQRAPSAAEPQGAAYSSFKSLLRRSGRPC